MSGEPSTGLVSRCPSCGAPLRFGGAHSLAAVCSYCRSAVARRGVDVALIGKVPDLVATDTRLALGLEGKIGNTRFTVLGHLQLQREAGDAAWDEWYCGFSDGTWGWLAEAQGRLHLTRPLDNMGGGRAPTFPFEVLRPGQRIDEPGIGVLAVEEVGTSRFVAAEGELPFSPAIGASYRFADLSAADGRFFTFDYGSASGEDEAQIFSGRRVGYDEAGLADRAPARGREPAEEGEALRCPNCGASLSTKLADTVSVTCPSCRSLLENGDRGVAILKKVASRDNPPIPLGSRGTLDGEAATVLGWMRRFVTVDGTKYTWDEYLLHGKSGYRWLTESEGQWHLVAPIEGGRVEVHPSVSATTGGRTFKHFQGAAARYEQIQGEFYWKVSADQRVHADDYVAPPFILSSENDGREETWSMGRWLAPEEVWAAFNLQGSPIPSVGIGAAQPNPHAERLRGALKVVGVALIAHIASCVVMAGALPGEKVLSVEVPLVAAPAPAPAPDPGDGTAPTTPAPPAAESNVFVSEPFELTGSRQAIEIKANAACDQAWVGLDTALINDETGESDAVGLDLSYYHGYSDGESWSEGSRSGSELIGGVKRGRYVLRVEPQFGKELAGTLPASVHVEVLRAPFRAGPWVFVLCAMLCWPLWLLLRRRGFEKRRWANSDHPMVSESSDE